MLGIILLELEVKNKLLIVLRWIMDIIIIKVIKIIWIKVKFTITIRQHLIIIIIVLWLHQHLIIIIIIIMTKRLNN